MLFLRRLLVPAALTLAFLYSASAQSNFLTAEEQAAGWKLLFDGKNVTGFRGLEKPDFLGAGWRVEGGALVLPKTIDESGRVTGGDLVTSAQYGDFEFA